MSGGEWGSAFIDDGYEVDGYIAGVERLHPPVSFRFRAMIQQERTRTYQEQQEAKTTDAQEERAAKVMAAKLLSWDVTDASGKVVDITVRNVLRLHPRVYIRMLNQITGLEAPDARPCEPQEFATLEEAGKN